MRMILVAGALLLAMQPSTGPALADRPAQKAPTQDAYVERGKASWYGPGFQGERTASGEIYDQKKMTAAHRKLPFGTEVLVTNLENGKKVKVEINDRGPYARGRIIDVSKEAGKKLDILSDGTARVRIEAAR